ncbi:MAG: hypothetical protein CEN87_49 [Parcubacteria group bacterium Licking1014_1]|nr:MAG: hypothetical protein CEN87_49 [Parcubacteria group bacterium Licking1014_1]
MEIDRPIAIAIMLFIILLLMFFLVVPKYQVFKDLQIKLGEKKAEFSAKYAYFAEITRVFYELDSRKDSLRTVDDVLPANPFFGKLAYFFQKTAAENGLIVKDLFLTRYSPTNQESDIKEIVFSFNLAGSYSALKNLILSLEKSSRLFEFTNISFSSSSEALSEAPAKTPTQSQAQQARSFSFTLEVKAYSH